MVLVSPVSLVSLEMCSANLNIAFKAKLRYIARCRSGKKGRPALTKGEEKPLTSRDLAERF